MFLFLQTIQAVQPDVVLVELCKSRVDILKYDEEFLLREAKNIDMQKLKLAIKQVGTIHVKLIIRGDITWLAQKQFTVLNEQGRELLLGIVHVCCAGSKKLLSRDLFSLNIKTGSYLENPITAFILPAHRAHRASHIIKSLCY